MYKRQEALSCQAVTPVEIEHNEPGMADETVFEPTDEPIDEPDDGSMNDEPSFDDSEPA